MMTYALGALSMYALVYGNSIQTIKMTIVQPAPHSVSDWEISRSELEAWARDVLTLRQSGQTVRTPATPAPVTGAGSAL